MSTVGNEQPTENMQPGDADRSAEDYPEGDVPEYRADVAAKTKSGTYPREYRDGDTVKAKETVGGVSRKVTVTVKKGQLRRNGWEYQLKTPKGKPFRDGVWVKEGDITV